MYTFVAAAMFGSDYNNVSSSKVFSSGSVNSFTRCINITIIDDDALEGNQSFILALTSPDPDVAVHGAVTTIVVEDNDC